ncbi:MAG TPA: cytochrome c maturation protein CcmE [Alphaproteobacteria bacterium]|jgi:cytochrome c-type biogenesis protein CcmE|nr:cytochrome c maturation protein CcmE [Alphaproteobacteria bacterium]
MTRKRRRLYFLLIGMAALGVAAALVLSAFRDNLVFFYSPSEILTKHVAPDRRVRIGGLVEKGSVEKQPDGLTVTFRITDLAREIPVTYTGALPDLFREGQGVVAEGNLRGDGTFQATEVLAKHDEKYMPPEVVKALKKSGRWQDGETAPMKPPS